MPDFPILRTTVLLYLNVIHPFNTNSLNTYSVPGIVLWSSGTPKFLPSGADTLEKLK